MKIKKLTQYYTDARAVWILVVFVLVFSLFYIVFTFQTVTNIVERRDVNQYLATLSAEINKLEFQYIRKKNEMDINTARKLGMTYGKEATYISRPTLSQRDQSNQL